MRKGKISRANIGINLVAFFESHAIRHELRAELLQAYFQPTDVFSERSVHSVLAEIIVSRKAIVFPAVKTAHYPIRLTRGRVAAALV